MRIELRTGSVYEFEPTDETRAIEALNSGETNLVFVETTAPGGLYVCPADVIYIDGLTD